MRNFNVLFLFAFIVITSLSCKKGCNLPEDEYKGVIYTDAIIYPGTGYITDVYPNGAHFDGINYGSDRIEVSINGGPRYPLADISGTYHVLAYRTNVKCDVSFVREVLIDHANQIATYNIVVTECDKGCDEIRGVENYVLVPAFPSNYTLVCNVQ